MLGLDSNPGLLFVDELGSGARRHELALIPPQQALRLAQLAFRSLQTQGMRATAEMEIEKLWVFLWFWAVLRYSKLFWVISKYSLGRLFKKTYFCMVC